MGLSVYNIKKWVRMLSGKSIMHVNQDMGKSFVPGEVKGYFNNLTEKVLKDPETLEKMTIPMSTDEIAGTVYFPIAIFQYGLGAYDLYLQTGEKIYKNQFLNCVNWALTNQIENGSWNNFGFVQPEAPYSSMCQGEGSSLLVRAYIETQCIKYLVAAQKAIDFMLMPISEGGTAQYEDDEVILYEYTNKPCVLNGWIFSIFGIYDLWLINKDEKYHDVYQKCVGTLCNHLADFDCGYWSYYDRGGLITSPFYHDLHIAQLEALSLICEDKRILVCKDKFVRCKRNMAYRVIAFLKKAIQKIMEK